MRRKIVPFDQETIDALSQLNFTIRDNKDSALKLLGRGEVNILRWHIDEPLFSVTINFRDGSSLHCTTDRDSVLFAARDLKRLEEENRRHARRIALKEKRRTGHMPTESEISKILSAELEAGK